MPRLPFLRHAAPVVSLVLAAIVFPRASFAIPISWDNAAGGNWNTPGNWSPAQVPTSADDVTIDLAGTYTVTIDTSPTVLSLALGGASGTQTLTGTSRTITVNGPFTVSTNGAFDFNNCTLSGTGSLAHSGQSSRLFNSCTVNLPLTNNSTLRVVRSGIWSGAYTSGAGSTLQVESENFFGSTLTTSLNLTNNGTLELITTSGNQPANLTCNSASLINTAGSTVLVSLGNGGARTLTCQLLNSGTVTVNAATTLAGSGADHVNNASGLIDLAGGNLTISQSGATPTFTHNGSITVPTTRVLSVSGGEFVLGASMAGAGSFSITSLALTQNVDYVTGSLPIAVNNCTINGPGTFRNSVGATTVLFNSTTVNSALVNDGTLQVVRSGIWNGAYTSGAGSVLRIESENFIASTLTTSLNLTNNGTLELITTSGNQPANLTCNSASLINTAGSTVLVSAGTGGARTLTCQLLNSGTVTVNAATTLAGSGADHVNNASGLIDLAGGNLTITQSGTTPTLLNNGTLSIAATRTLTATAGTVTNAATGTIRGSGTLVVSGTTFANQGKYMPGASSGILTVTGSSPSTSSASIDLEIGGLTAGTGYDRLAVSGNLGIDGTINVSLINGFMPVPGDVFQVLTFGSSSGGPPNITGLDLGGGLSFFPQFSGTSLTLICVGQTWVHLVPNNSIPGRQAHSAAYRGSSNRMVVFGGLGNAGVLNDVWVLTNSNGQGGTPVWTQLAPTGGPPSARESHRAVMDDANNRMIVFGGDDAAGPSPVANNEVWVLTNADGTGGSPAWTQLSPSGGPPAARTGHGAAYDVSSNRLVVFGGDSSPPCGTGLNDVWVLTNANGLGGAPAWTQLAPTGGPPSARAHAVTTYDAVTNRMTVVGGMVPCGATNNEMWVLSDANGIGAPAWTQLTPGGLTPPTPWAMMSGAYDAIADRISMFGGLVSGTPSGTNLTLSDGNGNGGTQLWVDLSATSDPPPPRSLHSAVQGNSQRMIVCAGLGAGGRLNDTWVLEQTQGRVVDVPPPVEPPIVTWRTGFSRSPSPNPAHGKMNFAITLSRAQKVDLAIHDIAGRRVAVLHQGTLEAGEHAFDWGASTARVPAGLYLLRLETEELRQVRKFVLAR